MYRVQHWHATLTKHIKEFTNKFENNTKKILSEVKKQKSRPSICTQTNKRESLAPGKNKNTYMDTEEAHGDM
jgi:hypothetical protein